MKKAFTLAELMIVLSVIGVLTAILLPAVRNAMPDKDVMKFKKGHRAFVEAVREMVNSEKYYYNGDLGMRANKQLLDTTHDGDEEYFCETFADIVNVKEKNCQNSITPIATGVAPNHDDESHNVVIKHLDSECKRYQTQGYLPDLMIDENILFYQTTPYFPMGAAHKVFHLNVHGDLDDYIADSNSCEWRRYDINYKNWVGTTYRYKAFCMDIDGFNEGEDPFGYGIRADGRILFGQRASEWIKKSVQGND